MAMTDEERAKRLEQIEADEAAEAKALQARFEERKIARADLKAKFTKDGLTEGEDFAITSVGDKMVVLKAPDFAIYKQYMAKTGSDPESMQQFVRGCVIHPTAMEFDSIVQADRKFEFARRCENAVFRLMGAREESYSGKS